MAADIWPPLLYLLGPAAVPAVAIALIGYFKDRSKVTPQAQTTLGLVAVYADREQLAEVGRVGKQLIESIDMLSHTTREAVDDIKESLGDLEKEVWKLRSTMPRDRG